jgi:hypothetical protein
MVTVVPPAVGPIEAGTEVTTGAAYDAVAELVPRCRATTGTMSQPPEKPSVVVQSMTVVVLTRHPNVHGPNSTTTERFRRAHTVS